MLFLRDRALTELYLVSKLSFFFPVHPSFSFRPHLRPGKRLKIIDEWLHGAKDFQCQIGKIRAKDLIIAKRMESHELFVADQFDFRMVFIIPPAALS